MMGGSRRCSQEKHFEKQLFLPQAHLTELPPGFVVYLMLLPVARVEIARRAAHGPESHSDIASFRLWMASLCEIILAFASAGINVALQAVRMFFVPNIPKIQKSCRKKAKRVMESITGL
jgi:hypothetical protein